MVAGRSAGALPAEDFARLEGVLLAAQRRGFLGPGPVSIHVERAIDLAAAVPVPPRRALDLGSGAGVPGLPLALLWPRSTWFLLDGSTTRAALLEGTVEQLRVGGRVKVLACRAEEAGRGELRGSLDLVVARSFAGPAVTAECASPFLKVGGLLVVAEPPGGDRTRWDPDGLARLGLELGETGAGPTSHQTLRQVTPCPERYPRRVGVPAKRPLF